ncbi:conserved domain protein [Fibrobacter succinogenes subsp. succinogenes S85]|uniref:Conserved domain protein n=1 Tax=Fibrobacter succinogenes (strain ATCC 19169 / S85) TaxID=59374 RepID=C9RPZ2_FIBSS|nr:PD-(D/E)XK nuclease family protein [Fibrobacter succinogenes]ACX74669.1 hypothetical protein Fisuc_1064 [Fibrobacter succinogenes subsp. succinogenes S85]ADL26499.1 conserved domain protein [Fibrobacter succinogenes subsp. succinogenes S85]
MNANTEILSNLLSKIESIKRKYENVKKEKDLFNVFEVLKLENVEKKHSAFIAELLNPKGSHKQSSKYLKLFFQRLNLRYDDLCNVVCEKKVESEKYGKGFIDIFLETDKKENSVVIENKIYADDQNNQLAKYHDVYPKAQLLYLTLDGKDPSAKSLDGLPNNLYKSISYDTFILEWLNSCLDETNSKYRIYSLIDQYRELILKLTGQGMIQEEKRELVSEFTSTEDKLKLFFYMMQCQLEIKKCFADKIKEWLLQFANELNFKISNVEKLWEKYSSFDIIFNERWLLTVEFQKEYYGKFIVGLLRKNANQLDDDIIKLLLTKCSCFRVDDSNMKWRFYSDNIPLFPNESSFVDALEYNKLPDSFTTLVKELNDAIQELS